MRIKRKDNILRKLKRQRRMSVGTFWSECALRVISYICALVIMMIILSVALPVSPEELNRIVNIAAVVLGILWCIPIARNTRMRLRDAGFSPKAYLWLLLPVAGWVVFIALMCVKGKPQTPESTVEVL